MGGRGRIGKPYASRHAVTAWSSRVECTRGRTCGCRAKGGRCLALRPETSAEGRGRSRTPKRIGSGLSRHAKGRGGGRLGGRGAKEAATGGGGSAERRGRGACGSKNEGVATSVMQRTWRVLCATWHVLCVGWWWMGWAAGHQRGRHRQQGRRRKGRPRGWLQLGRKSAMCVRVCMYRMCVCVEAPKRPPPAAGGGGVAEGGSGGGG